jgi:hypothetical protein
MVGSNGCENVVGFIPEVKLAFFGGLNTLGRIEDPRLAAGSRVQVATEVDLAGMNIR